MKEKRVCMCMQIVELTLFVEELRLVLGFDKFIRVNGTTPDHQKNGRGL